MKNKKIFVLIITVLLLSITQFSVQAQSSAKKKERKKEFYFSWGYNTEYYTHSTVKVNQPSLNNNYSFVDISGHDHEGWNYGLFKQAVSIPQYNYRLGLIIDKKKDLGFEINFDHTKFIFADQAAHIKGTLNGRHVDSIINFNAANGFFYYLNNGANFLLFNIVKRWHWYAAKNEKVKVDFLGKAGIGPVIPHVQNEFFDSTNTPHFQLGGWNIGVEAAVRATFFNYVFLEYTNKLDYARYSNLKIDKSNGTAKQAFGTYEMILNLGVTFPVGKKVN
jgi:hypothetical protein